ncbi:MAG: class II aldolase/adducin family protein [Limnochordia bacterium]|jgi:ribulose-5-phosphate 4-epimerase/fuculose-1-phosphate aldolase
MNRQQLVEICECLYERGMVSGAGGNVSFRRGERIWITPSGRSLGELTGDDLVEIDGHGRAQTSGRPSREWPLHLAVYRHRPDVRAVIHTHSPYAVALACQWSPEEPIPMYTPSYALLVGRMPLLPYYPPGSSDLEGAVASQIPSFDGLLLQNHGVVAVGSHLTAALTIAEEIEDNARIYFLTGGRGRGLTDEQLAELRQMYK